MVSIKEFFELREAGYSVDQIKEYSSFMEAPEKQPEQKPEQSPEQKPEQAPEQKPEPEEKPKKTAEQILADAVRPEAPKDPTQEQVKEIKDTLSMLLGAVRGMNINNAAMPKEEGRTEQEILAEIINPPGKGGK